MIRDFEYYVGISAVKKKIPNIALAKSLLEKASKRLERLYGAPINSDYASLILEDAYEAVREAAQSLMEVHGFKPYSHEAIIAFLSSKQFLSVGEREELNRYRILRNDSVYEARSVSVETCKDALDFAKHSIPKIKKLFLDEVGDA